MADYLSSVLKEYGIGDKKDKEPSYLDSVLTEYGFGEQKAPATRNPAAFLNDTVITGANAVLGAVQAGSDFISPGNRFSQGIEGLVREGEESQSDVVKQGRAKLGKALDTEDIGTQLKGVKDYVLQNPVQAAAMAAGSFALPFGAIKGAKLASGALGLSEKAAARLAVGSGMATSGVLAGGDAAGDAYQQVMNSPELATMPINEREALATSAARKASAVPFVIGAISGAFGADKALATGTRSLLKTGASEFVSESIEEGATKLSANIAAENAGVDVGIFKGVAGAAALGGVLGGGTGLAVGALTKQPDSFLSGSTNNNTGTDGPDNNAINKAIDANSTEIAGKNTTQLQVDQIKENQAELQQAQADAKAQADQAAAQQAQQKAQEAQQAFIDVASTYGFTPNATGTLSLGKILIRTPEIAQQYITQFEIANKDKSPTQKALFGAVLSSGAVPVKPGATPKAIATSVNTFLNNWQIAGIEDKVEAAEWINTIIPTIEGANALKEAAPLNEFYKSLTGKDAPAFASLLEQATEKSTKPKGAKDEPLQQLQDNAGLRAVSEQGGATQVGGNQPGDVRPSGVQPIQSGSLGEGSLSLQTGAIPSVGVSTSTSTGGSGVNIPNAGVQAQGQVNANQPKVTIKKRRGGVPEQVVEGSRNVEQTVEDKATGLVETVVRNVIDAVVKRKGRMSNVNLQKLKDFIYYDFSQIENKAAKTGELTKKELADMFGVSADTIDGWQDIANNFFEENRGVIQAQLYQTLDANGISLLELKDQIQASRDFAVGEAVSLEEEQSRSEQVTEVARDDEEDFEQNAVENAEAADLGLTQVEDESQLDERDLKGENTGMSISTGRTGVSVQEENKPEETINARYIRKAKELEEAENNGDEELVAKINQELDKLVNEATGVAQKQVAKSEAISGEKKKETKNVVQKRSTKSVPVRKQTEVSKSPEKLPAATESKTDEKVSKVKVGTDVVVYDKGAYIKGDTKNDEPKASIGLKEINPEDDLYDQIGNATFIYSFDVTERNKGYGSQLLNAVVDWANKNKKTLALIPAASPDSALGGLNQQQLKDWYSRNGFESIGDAMVRKPNTALAVTEQAPKEMGTLVKSENENVWTLAEKAEIEWNANAAKLGLFVYNALPEEAQQDWKDSVETGNASPRDMQTVYENNQDAITKTDEKLNEQIDELKTIELDALEEHYGNSRESNEFFIKVKNDVAAYVNKGAQAVDAAIRSIIKSIANGLMAIAVVFNPAQLTTTDFDFPLFVSETRAATMPAPAAAEMSSVATKAYEISAPAFVKANQTFFIADKPNGKIHLFDKTGKHIASSDSLYGKQAGDRLTEEQRTKPMAAMSETDKITPAGTFTVQVVASSEYAGGYTLHMSDKQGYLGGLAIHSVYTGDAKENRLDKLLSKDLKDKKISFGCINTSSDFFINKVLPRIGDMKNAGVVIIPDAQDTLAQYIEPTFKKVTTPAPKTESRDAQQLAAKEEKATEETTKLSSKSKKFFFDEIEDTERGFDSIRGILAELGIENALDFVSSWSFVDVKGGEPGSIESIGGRYVVTVNNNPEFTDAYIAETASHEIGHAVDMALHGGIYSAQKEMGVALKDGVITPVGAVAREMHNLYKNNPLWNEFLAYPFNVKTFTNLDTHVKIESELFAQLFAVYTDPRARAKLEAEAPITAAYMKEVVNDIKSTKALQIQTPRTAAEGVVRFQNRNATQRKETPSGPVPDRQKETGVVLRSRSSKELQQTANEILDVHPNSGRNDGKGFIASKGNELGRDLLAISRKIKLFEDGINELNSLIPDSISPEQRAKREAARDRDQAEIDKLNAKAEELLETRQEAYNQDAEAGLLSSKDRAALAGTKLNSRSIKEARIFAEKQIDRLPKPVRGPLQNMMANIYDFAKKGLPYFAYTQDLADIANKYIPSAKTYVNLTKGRQAIRTKFERNVDLILQQYDKLSDAVKGTGENSVNRLIKDITMDGKWPYNPGWIKDFDETKDIDAGMKTRFDAMPNDAQALIKKVFGHGQSSLLAMQKAVNENINTEYDALIAAANAVNDTKEAADLTKKKAATLTEYNTLMRTNSKKPYAPLKRFGNYVVVGKSQLFIDNETIANSKTAAPDEVAAARKKMRELEKNENEYFVQFAETAGEANAIVQAEKGNYDYLENFEKDTSQGFGVRDLNDVFSRLRNMVEEGTDSNLSEASQKTMNRLMADLKLTLLSETSARQSERRRKNVAGAEDDMMRSFATQGRATASFIASMENSGDIYDTLRDMKKEADAYDGVGTRAERRRYYNEFMKRHFMGMDYEPSPFIDKALSTTSMWMLLTNPAYYLQNGTQTFMMSLPVIAGRHGYTRSWKEMQRAYTDVFNLIRETKGLNEESYAKLPADVRQVVEELVNRGRIDISLEQDLGRWRSTEDSKLAKFTNVMDKLRGVAQDIETVNRVATAIAAYRLEAKRSNPTNAVNYADKIIYTTHGDYSVTNAPRITRKGLGRLATQFRKFQLIQISLIARLSNDAFNGEDAETRMIGKKALAFTIGHTAVMGGIMGLPGFTAIAFLYGLLFGDDDEPDNPELALRKAIGNDTIADLLLKGVPAALGVDLSGKLGMGNMLSILPYTDVKFTRKDLPAAGFALLTGPFGGLTLKAADAVDYIGRGDYYKGIEQLLPTGFSNSMKGYRYATEGITSKSGDITMSADDISAVDGFMVALGLPTKTITDRQFLQNAKFTYDEFYNEKTSELKREYVRAYSNNDAEAKKDVIEAWAKLQKSRAENGYTKQPLSDLLKAPQEKRKRERNTVGGVAVNKANRGFVKKTSEL